MSHTGAIIGLDGNNTGNNVRRIAVAGGGGAGNTGAGCPRCSTGAPCGTPQAAAASPGPGRCCCAAQRGAVLQSCRAGPNTPQQTVMLHHRWLFEPQSRLAPGRTKGSLGFLRLALTLKQQSQNGHFFARYVIAARFSDLQSPKGSGTPSSFPSAPAHSAVPGTPPQTLGPSLSLPDTAWEIARVHFAITHPFCPASIFLRLFITGPDAHECVV